MTKSELRVLSGKQVGAMIPLAAGKFLIGREHDCHLRPNSELISRHHCVFTVDEYTVRLRDLGSTNGTLVNDERIRGGVVLKAGDRITVGKLDFQLVIDGKPVSSTDDTMVRAQDETQIGLPTLTPAVAASDTMTEIEVGMPADDSSADDTQFGAPLVAAAQATPAVGGEAPMTPGYPAPPTGYPQQGYPPQGYSQYPPVYPFGYGYPYPPQMPQGYPPAGYGYPSAPPQQAPDPPAPAAAPSGFPEVRLPDPSETGVKPPEPKPVAAVDAKGKPAHIPSAAQDIINQYLTRRPKTE
jgi:predicted component of type VI protein secretion system